MSSPEQLGGLQSLADVEAFESVPLGQRSLPASTYELLMQGCRRSPDKVAIGFFLRGSEYSPEKVTWRSRAAHWAMRWLKGERIAVPLVEYRFSELAGYVTRTANLLSALGVGKDDVVSLLLPNLPETHFALWGAEAAGIVNPINPLLEPDVIADIMRAAGSKVLVTLGELPGSDLWAKVGKVIEAVSSLRHVVLVHGRGSSAVPVTRYWKAIHSYPHDHLQSGRVFSPDDLASLFHTGGTTGLPKLARHTHANEVAMSWIVFESSPRYARDRILVGLPLFHANAALGTGLAPFSGGVGIILAGPSGFRTPGVFENFFAIAAHYKITWFSAVPTVLSALMATAEIANLESTVRWAAIGAAPCPIELHHAFQQRTGIRLIAVYGLTEGTLLTTRGPADSDPRIGSAGFRLPYVEAGAFLIDNQGIARPCATNDIGIIAQRGLTTFPGYLDDAHNRDLWLTDADGQRWLNTGDLGRFDSEGYLWLTGRAKELIIRGGHNIDPACIEAALNAHPAVALAAAVGRPDAYAGEIPVVYVSLKPGTTATSEELLQHATNAISERAAVPKEVVIVQALPTTAVGKIFKPDLVGREIERACRLEIERLADSIRDSSVRVERDRTLGLVAHVRVMTKPDVNAEEVKNQLDEALGHYTFRWRTEASHG